MTSCGAQFSLNQILQSSYVVGGVVARASNMGLGMQGGGVRHGQVLNSL